MNFDQILEMLNGKLLVYENRSLNATEILILRGIWQNQTYNQIAQQEGYSPSYFANVVAPELCRRLSNLIGKRVTKKNCRAMLQLYISEQTKPETIFLQHSGVNLSQDLKYNSSPSYPSGAVPLNSPFYLTNSSLENQILEEISKPGALVRIKAPQEMGKTSLLLRILDYCQQQLGYRTISLDLQKADQVILNDINQFLRWLCVNSARQLGLQPKLDDYWDEDLGCKMSWTLYFEEYLLEKIDTPIILALDEVNQIFEHPQVADDFLPLLRSCYEEAKRRPLWQKLRLIVVHSTEIYVTLHLEKSPFNVGLPIQLEGFSFSQVLSLAQKYGFNWTNGEEVKQLMDMVEGHPALIHLALYHLYQGNITLAQLLRTAPTSTGIYAHHLQRHWVNLQEQPDLAKAFRQVMEAAKPVLLDPIIAYKLNSMGLIHLEENRAMISCELYRQYFQNQQESNLVKN